MPHAWIDGSSRVEAAVYFAQRHAGSFGGEELRAVAIAVAAIAAERGLELLAADNSGDRILGTASVLTDCALADTSRRFDGRRLLLVAGMIAGPFGLMQAAAIARSAGASEVQAVHLGGWQGELPGCDDVHVLRHERDVEGTDPGGWSSGWFARRLHA